MMKNIKRSILGVLLAMGLVIPAAQAAQYSTTIANASTLYTLAFTNQNYLIQEIVLANAGAGPTTVSFFDAESTNQTYVRTAFTNTTSYITNIVTTFTNYNGWIQTNTNTGTFSFSSTYGATTNSRVKLVSLAVGPTNTVTYRPINGLSGGYGLVVTNLAATNLSVTVTYTY